MKLMTEKDFISIKDYNDLNILDDFLSNFFVSSISCFKDNIWILDTKPNLQSVTFKIEGKCIKNKKLILFWKLISFCVLSNMTEVKYRNKGFIGFFYTFKVLITFLNEKDFLHPNGLLYLSKLNTNEYIKRIAELDTSSSDKHNKLKNIRHWFNLSKYLPNEIKLSVYPITNRISSIFPYTDSERSWQPIAYDEINLTIKESLKLMEYSEDIFKCLSEWKMYSGLEPVIKKFSAFGRKYNNTKASSEGNLYKLAEIIFRIFKERPNEAHPLLEIWDVAKLINDNKIYLKEVDILISKQSIRDIISALYGACLIIILISTGLRKSELYSLKRGCIKENIISDIPLLENESFKTDFGINHIPISKYGVNAVSILEKMAFILTEEKEGPLIFVIGRNGKKDINALANMSTYAVHKISKFYDYIGFEGDVPHLHQYRHTLSTAIWERSEQAPVLIQMLYHHTSLTMSMKYLRKNPILRQDKKTMIELTFKPLIKKIIMYNNNNELAGPALKKVTSLVNFVKFEGKTENEILVDLEDLMTTLVLQDQMRIFLTPLCICLKSNNNTEKSPCMLIDQSDEFFEGLPRTDKCVGSICKDSLYSPLHKDIIDQSYKFYDDILENLENTSNILMLNLVKLEHNKYKQLQKMLNRNKVM